MSANARGKISGVTPRVVRIRNRCLKSLAKRRALPIPTTTDLEKLDDQVALVDAIEQWESAHKPPAPRPRGFDLPPRPRARWQSPLFIRSAAVLVAAVIGILAGRHFFPRAGAQSPDAVLEQPWLAVTDSVADAANGSIYRVAEDNRRSVLTAADVAALIFRSPRRHTVFVDSIEARADSSIAIRGRLAGAASFELRGDLRLVRRGVAELIVRNLSVDGTEIAPTMITRLVARGRARSEDSDRLRFDVPASVTNFIIAGGEIALLR